MIQQLPQTPTNTEDVLVRESECIRGQCHTPKTRLRQVLTTIDGFCALLAWALPALVWGTLGVFRNQNHLPTLVGAIYIASGVAFSIFLITCERLYRSRTCEIRTNEIMRIARGIPYIVLVSLTLSKLFGEDHLARIPLLTGFAFFFLVNFGRMAFRS